MGRECYGPSLLWAEMSGYGSWCLFFDRYSVFNRLKTMMPLITSEHTKYARFTVSVLVLYTYLVLKTNGYNLWWPPSLGKPEVRKLTRDWS